jgi:hypothetical protein
MFMLKLSHVQAGGIAAVGLAGMAMLAPSAALFAAGFSIAGLSACALVSTFPKSNAKKIREVFEATNYRNKNGEYPVKLNMRSDKHHVYELPPGRCPEEFGKLQPYINSHLKAETEIYSDNGQLHIRVMADKIPGYVKFEYREPPERMVLPIPVGQSRAGFIWADLAELPHLVVAGETYGGKSNFLHQAIAVLVRSGNVKLYVIDLKKVEFGYLHNHAELAMTLPDAVRVLESLCMLMMERMDLLLKKGRPNVGGQKLDYHVLIVDELSQLSPALATDPDVKSMRKDGQQMLTDLLCLARALGIHVIVSTQRPDKDVLPGQLKANIPAALCFKVKNEINSRIVLDNDKADSLPRIKGRAIWQFDVEREVQVQYLPVRQAKAILPKVSNSKPVRHEVLADGRM